MINGDLVIEQNEAKTIRYIFESYIAGATLKEIAERLTAERVVYSEKNTEWNKARIMRILDNVKYLGDDRFAQIIDDTIYAEAARQKTARQRTTPGLFLKITTRLAIRRLLVKLTSGILSMQKRGSAALTMSGVLKIWPSQSDFTPQTSRRLTIWEQELTQISLAWILR